MARRRSCFSCGEVQGGSGAFCSTCGKPLDAPDLEFLAVDSTATTGNDVVMATGGGRGRSAIVIVAVLAALGGVAAFAGKGTTSSTATTSTIAKKSTSTTTSTATTTTDQSTTTTTDAATASARELARTQPHTVATPILPEKTGTKLLLVGLVDAATGQRSNAIVDLDSGVVTPYAADDISGEVVVQTYGSRLLVTDTSSGRLRFDTWQSTGRTGSVDAQIENSDVFDPANILAGDVVWAMARNPLVPENNVTRLVGYDARDGHKTSDVVMPESARLIGFDAANHPVVVDYGSGTYSFDPTTKQFARITTNLAAGARGEMRVERQCTEQLVCGTVLLNGTDAARSIPDDADLFNGTLAFSPNGQTLVQVSYRNGGPPSLEAVDVATGTRKKLGMEADSYPIRTAWSADGTWLFGLRNGALAAWKVGTADTLPITFDGDPVRVTSFGAFPA